VPGNPITADAVRPRLESIRRRMIAGERRILFVLLLLTFALRVVHTAAVFRNSGERDWSDDHEYLAYGRQIAAGNWTADVPGRLPVMRVAPILPVIIAGAIRCFGSPIWPVFILNCLMTALAVPVLFFLGRAVFNRKTAWIGAAWGMLYPDHFKYDPHLLKEPILYLVLPLTILLLVRAARRDGGKWALPLSALGYGVLIHADERFLAMGPLLAAAFLLERPLLWRRAFRKAAFWSAIVVLLMIPWTIRNVRVFGQVVLISPRTTAFTSRLWGSDISGTGFSDAELAGRIIERRMAKATSIQARYGVEPRVFGPVERYGKAFVHFWQPAFFKPTFIQDGTRFQKWSLRHNLFGILFYGIFLPFYVVAVAFSIRRGYALGIWMASLPLFHSVLHTVMIWPLERYRSPVVFSVVLTGAAGVFDLAALLRNRRVPRKEGRPA
jgi:hypothetical protein